MDARESRNRRRRGAAGLAAGMGLLVLTGCGWTPRDQYMADRGLKAHAGPGDGSRIATGWVARDFRSAPEPAQAVANADGR